MSNLPGFLQGWPVWVVFVVLFFGAYARGNATYWLGRGARTGSERTRWKAYAQGPLVRAAERWVRRLGPPLVSIGFLTVGVQSAINFAAGVLRMPQRHFQPAVVVGALLWSTLYTTVGFAVIDAFLGGLSWWWAGLAVAVLAFFVGYSRWLGARGERQGRALVADQSLPEHLGPDDLGSETAGAGLLGPDHLGPNDLGPDHLGPDHLGPDHLGPDHLGPNAQAMDPPSHVTRTSRPTSDPRRPHRGSPSVG